MRKAQVSLSHLIAVTPALASLSTSLTLVFYLFFLSAEVRETWPCESVSLFCNTVSEYVCVCVLPHTGQLGEACPQKPEQHEHRTGSAPGPHGSSNIVNHHYIIKSGFFGDVQLSDLSALWTVAAFDSSQERHKPSTVILDNKQAVLQFFLNQYCPFLCTVIVFTTRDRICVFPVCLFVWNPPLSSTEARGRAEGAHKQMERDGYRRTRSVETLPRGLGPRAIRLLWKISVDVWRKLRHHSDTRCTQRRRLNTSLYGICQLPCLRSRPVFYPGRFFHLKSFSLCITWKVDNGVYSRSDAASNRARFGENKILGRKKKPALGHRDVLFWLMCIFNILKVDFKRGVCRIY